LREATKLWQRLERDYLDEHKHATNRLLHRIGVPLIVFSILLALHGVPWFDAPFWVVLGWSASYAIGSRVLATITLILFIVAWILSAWVVEGTGSGVPWALTTILFLGGWTLLLYGHRLEGNRPAFRTNLVHLWVAPMALVSEVKRGFTT